jgi:two-component system, OmpR family, response regulator
MDVLIIEDDPTLSNNIRDALASEQLNVECAYDGNMAERILKNRQFDCIVMDINLPGKHGFELCRDFRKYNQITPVIILTALGELEDKIRGFDCGADDYLAKPFYMRELILRVNALIKRKEKFGSEVSNQVIIADDITLDDAKKTVFRNGTELTLTPREYQILMKLMENKGEIVSKSDLIKEIWGSSFSANTNTIEVYVNFLRNKIDKPFGKSTIKTKVGYGYYLDLK